MDVFFLGPSGWPSLEPPLEAESAFGSFLKLARDRRRRSEKNEGMMPAQESREDAVLCDMVNGQNEAHRKEAGRKREACDPVSL